jgi:hypothetical protein
MVARQEHLLSASIDRFVDAVEGVLAPLDGVEFLPVAEAPPTNPDELRNWFPYEAVHRPGSYRLRRARNGEEKSGADPGRTLVAAMADLGRIGDELAAAMAPHETDLAAAVQEIADAAQGRDFKHIQKNHRSLIARLKVLALTSATEPAAVNADVAAPPISSHPLLEAAKSANLLGAEMRVIRAIAEKDGRIKIADADTLCQCDALSAFKRVKKRKEFKGWKLRQIDNHLCAEPIKKRGRN